MLTGFQEFYVGHQKKMETQICRFVVRNFSSDGTQIVSHWRSYMTFWMIFILVALQIYCNIHNIKIIIDLRCKQTIFAAPDHIIPENRIWPRFLGRMAVNLDMYGLLYELNNFSKDLISVSFCSENLGTIDNWSKHLLFKRGYGAMTNIFYEPCFHNHLLSQPSAGFCSCSMISTAAKPKKGPI